ncbi:MAG: tRNA (adenosine(37)-N6)-dimethylallyltransferase MiaA [Candidatus Nomurabacteria bacterium]|jgi:tRNA dimethylallyltransferase|nr:tRNA (adenosine(37)-N6)-dimethylallyltransferase MiaA [Candidatus Nomurabacteria bacterium]
MKRADRPLVAIMGPTASGKTALALKLAREFDGEIICADSRTIYKGMDIGTAKPTKEEQRLVPHHMLDLVELGEKYTVYQFKKAALRLIDEIRGRGRVPFLVGGSGLYLYAVLFNYDFDEENRRDDLIPNCIAVGLEVEKEVLQERIASRFQQMLDAGLEAEVKKLVKKYDADTPQLKRNSYGEMQKYLRGEISRAELLERAKIVDWQLAKKQRTWFRHHGHDQIKWLPLEEAENYLRKELKL